VEIKLLAGKVYPYLNNLTNRYTNIESVWLFGSRANNDYNEKSDWDLFIFSDEEVLDLLRSDMDVKNESEECNIDLLVVFDGDNFNAPWKISGEENKEYKEGCLFCSGGFSWSKISSVEAEYTETKDIEGKMYPMIRRRKAWRIWP